MGKTLFDKIWEAHVIKEIENGPSLLYIDRHLIHEVTSPQAFLAIKEKGLRVRRPDMTFATCDHNTPTLHQELPIEEPSSAKAVAQLAANTKEFGIKYLFMYAVRSAAWCSAVRRLYAETVIQLPTALLAILHLA